jgi:hypothetical protein
MNEDTEYDRGVASRARQLLQNTPDMESREMLKAIIMLIDPRDEDAQRPIAVKRRQSARA